MMKKGLIGLFVLVFTAFLSYVFMPVLRSDRKTINMTLWEACSALRS